MSHRLDSEKFQNFSFQPNQRTSTNLPFLRQSHNNNNNQDAFLDFHRPVYEFSEIFHSDTGYFREKKLSLESRNLL